MEQGKTKMEQVKIKKRPNMEDHSFIEIKDNLINVWKILLLFILNTMQ